MDLMWERLTAVCSLKYLLLDNLEWEGGSRRPTSTPVVVIDSILQAVLLHLFLEPVCDFPADSIQAFCFRWVGKCPGAVSHRLTGPFVSAEISNRFWPDERRTYIASSLVRFFAWHSRKRSSRNRSRSGFPHSAVVVDIAGSACKGIVDDADEMMSMTRYSVNSSHIILYA